MPSKKQDYIEIKGANTHNLKNVDVSIPLNKITCIYGPSGSGKSSLAFHTLLAESKRRYMNSLPNDVKFFWNMPTSADVDSIKPVLPVWGLAQINPILGSRPNVADTIGIGEKLQKLWSTFGSPSCPTHKKKLLLEDWGETFQNFVKEGSDFSEGDVFHILCERGIYASTFGDGATPARSYNFEKDVIGPFSEEDLYWEVFRFKAKSLKVVKAKISDSKIPFSKLFICRSEVPGFVPLPQNNILRCPECDHGKLNKQYSPLEFSPYNAGGACSSCSGHGMNLEYDRLKVVKYPYLPIEEGAISILESSHFSYLYEYLVKELKKQRISLSKPFENLPQKKLWKLLEEGAGDWPGLKSCYDYLNSRRYKRTVRIFSRRLKSEVLCEACHGTRINEDVQNHIISDLYPITFKEIWLFSLKESKEQLEKLKKVTKDSLVKRNLEDILGHLDLAGRLGLENLSMWKKSKYISSSEYQRSLLTKILSYQGSGSMFILDEPSFDLTLEDQGKLFESLEQVRDQGNTVVIVEHSEYLRNQSDFNIQMGPGAGYLGGEVLKSFKPKKSRKPTETKKRKKIKRDATIEVLEFEKVVVEGKLFSKMTIPIGKTTVLWGDSSSLKDFYFKNLLANNLNYFVSGEPLLDMKTIDPSLILSSGKKFEGVYLFDSSLGKVSSRSTVGTTIGLSPELRKYFAKLPVSRELSLEKGHFSPNSELGRCPSCEGKGIKEIEMSFLEDIVLVCDDCEGKKLKPFIASISDGHITIDEAYALPMTEVIPRLPLTPKFKKLWSLVELLNLSYLSLGRPLSSLSGGERLRVKLVSQLASKLEDSILIFDNISSGLSKPEVEKLFDFVDSLTHSGNTIIVADQNPSVISMAYSEIKL